MSNNPSTADLPGLSGGTFPLGLKINLTQQVLFEKSLLDKEDDLWLSQIKNKSCSPCPDVYLVNISRR